MTIAEMIAAKAAAAVAKTLPPAEGTDLLGDPTSDRVIVMQDGPHYAKLVDSTGRFIKWLPKPEPVAYVDPDLDAAINRIDPPGKQSRSEASKAARALILNDAPTKESPPPSTSSPTATAELRSLGSHRGEMIDMTPPGASQAVSDWHQAAIQPETSLCLVRDKHDPERAWIAVQMDGNRTPILLMSLPLFDATTDPF